MRKAGRRPDPETVERDRLFHDALADWTNDDVLQTEEARAALGGRYPGGLRVLDWPELRALFARYDPPATRHGRRDRRFALLSVGLAGLGLVLAMASPLAVGAERVMEMAAAALVVASLAIMGLHKFRANSRARSLGQRFGAERVRALYFQAVVNNLDLASRAMADDAALADWKAARARMLMYLPEPEDLPGQIPKLADPVDDDAETWVGAEWSKAPTPPEPSADLDLLLWLLRGQRLDGQIDYLQRKLSASLGAPGRRAAVARGLSKFLLAAAVATGAMSGVLIAMGRELGSTDVKLALEITVGAIVAVMALGVINNDRALASDATRYAAYLAVVSDIRARFRAGGLAEKLVALREMEIAAYRDLREFVGNHWRSR